MFEEPIRILSAEQAAELKASSNGAPAPPPSDDAAKLGRRIWQLALAGNNRDQIAERLKIPLELLDETLYAYRIRLGLSIDHYRLLDNERLDRLLVRYLPMALGGPITIQKIREGEAFCECDFDRPLKAGQFALQLMSQRTKILSASTQLEAAGGAPGSPGGKDYTERNIVIWLKEVMPSIERITRELEVINDDPVSQP
jgi:hypothetical protein